MDDLPNELLEQIAQYAEHWEELPASLAVFTVLSRVSRRLRSFALPHHFATLCLPVEEVAGPKAYSFKARPLSKILSLLGSDPIYKQCIKHFLAGPKFYPSLIRYRYAVDLDTEISVSQYAWQLFGAERTFPWNLESFASLDIGCSPTTVQILGSCVNLQTLTMYWSATTYPDLAQFPRLDTLRLTGYVMPRDVRDPRKYRTRPTLPCHSLRTLALHGVVHLPSNFVEHIHELYPKLRVLVAVETTLVPQDILHMITKHATLEEVNAEFVEQADLSTSRLENVIDVASGRVREWPQWVNAQTKVAQRLQPRRLLWTKLMVKGFAFARQKNDTKTMTNSGAPYKLTSLAIKQCGSDDGADMDELTAFFNSPAEFPFKEIRHLAFSNGGRVNTSFIDQQSVEGFMMHLTTMLSQWESLETFTFHYDLTDRHWQSITPWSDYYVPILDGTGLPSQAAGEEEPTLRRCLQFIPVDHYDIVLDELSRILNRNVGFLDEDIDLDAIWMERHLRTISHGAREMAEKCSQLRAFHWFVDLDDRSPGTSWAFKIQRDKEGRVRDVNGRSSESLLDDRSEQLFPFEVLVGQELRVAKNAWPRRHDRLRR